MKLSFFIVQNGQRFAFPCRRTEKQHHCSRAFPLPQVLLFSSNAHCSLSYKCAKESYYSLKIDSNKLELIQESTRTPVSFQDYHPSSRDEMHQIYSLPFIPLFCFYFHKCSKWGYNVEQRFVVQIVQNPDQTV